MSNQCTINLGNNWVRYLTWPNTHKLILTGEGDSRKAEFVPNESKPDLPWTGHPKDGRPPVGTACEVLYNSDPEEFVTCKVIGYDERDAVVRITRGKRTGQYERVPPAWTGRSVFRPIPTPEQIKAEQRKKEIAELLEVFSNLDGCSLAYARAAVNAGYRKFEIVDEQP